jgi:hypothetical protein
MANTIDTTEAPQIIEHMHKSLNFTPYDTKWVPCSARLVCLGITPKAKGILQIYEMNRGELTLVSETLKPEGLKCGTFGASSIEERHLACGDYKVGWWWGGWVSWRLVWRDVAPPPTHAPRTTQSHKSLSLSLFLSFSLQK